MSIDDTMGTILRDGERWGLQYRRHLAHPPEKVWTALTESQHLQHWLPCDLVGERRPGAPLELPFWPAHVTRYSIDPSVLSGEILAWDPPRVFEWTWDTDVLRWELEDLGDETVLTFTTWLGGDQPPANTAAGYHACLDNLVELLDTGVVSTPLVDADVGPLEERYAAATAEPHPSG